MMEAGRIRSLTEGLIPQVKSCAALPGDSSPVERAGTDWVRITDELARVVNPAPRSGISPAMKPAPRSDVAATEAATTCDDFADARSHLRGRSGDPGAPSRLDRALGPFRVFGLNLSLQSIEAYCRRYSGEPIPEASGEESYFLRIADGEVTIAADSSVGALHGLRTLGQLIALADDGEIPALVVHDYPLLATRGFQLCFHMVNDGMPMMAPRFESTIELIRTYAGFKMNAVLLEIEALFPYADFPELSATFAFSRRQINELRAVCAAHHVEIIPLIQTVGHAYNFLRHPEHAHLREVPDTTQQFCLTNPDVRRFLSRIIDDVAGAFPEIHRFHLGGDEARRLGACPDCARKLGERGMGRLYADHVNEVAAPLLERGITPVVWADIADHYPAVHDCLKPEIALAYWNYDIAGGHRPLLLEEYADSDRVVLGCSAAKFGRQSDHFPFYRKSMRTVAMMSEECIRTGAEGTIVTDWMKLAPSEVSATAISFGAETAWSGSADQSAFALAFSRLFYGVSVPEFDRLLKGLSGRATRPFESTSMVEELPFSEPNETLADLRDRFDLVYGNWRTRIQRYEDQTKWPLVVEVLTATVASLDGEVRPRLSRLRASVRHRTRFFDAIAAAARVRSLNSRIGLSLIDSMRLLKFPTPTDSDARAATASELRSLADEWERTAGEVLELNRRSTFAEVARINCELRFECFLPRFLRITAEKLESGRRVLSFLDS
jgi:hypothetical protein